MQQLRMDLFTARDEILKLRKEIDKLTGGFCESEDTKK
jgi:hypothetical protein